MKTQKQILKKIMLVLFLVTLSACSKDEETEPGPGPVTEGNNEIVKAAGATEDDFDTYKGDIGVIVETRSLTKKGYTPAQARMTINDNSGDYSQTIDLDPYTFMGQIKIPVAGISEATLNELKDGVEIKTEVLDESGNVIVEETASKVSFKSDANILSVKATALEDLNKEVHLKSNTPYYVQVLDEDKKPYATMNRNGIVSAYNAIAITAKASYTGDETALHFTFRPVEGKENTFSIKHFETGKDLRIHRSYIGSPTGIGLKIHQAIVADSNFSDDDLQAYSDSNFVIEKVEDGLYKIKSLQNEYIKDAPGVGLTLNYAGASLLYFRFIPLNIDWQIENIETHFLEPILPPAKTGFGFNNTLINCGNGSLEQTVGIEISETVSTTTGWEESVSVMSSHTASVSATVGVEFEAGFFGTKSKYSAEITAGYEYTTENTTENSKWGETTKETQEVYFSQRLVTVPPKNASLVYDAYQFYDNIKMNFVQRLRVKATEHDTSEALSGNEIKSQFHFNNFNGIITEVGSDYIEITLRGVTQLDKVIKTESKVKEADPMCN